MIKIERINASYTEIKFSDDQEKDHATLILKTGGKDSSLPGLPAGDMIVSIFEKTGQKDIIVL